MSLPAATPQLPLTPVPVCVIFFDRTTDLANDDQTSLRAFIAPSPSYFITRLVASCVKLAYPNSPFPEPVVRLRVAEYLNYLGRFIGIRNSLRERRRRVRACDCDWRREWGVGRISLISKGCGLDSLWSRAVFGVRVGCRWMCVVEMVWGFWWKFVMNTVLPFLPCLVSFSGVLIY